MKASLEEQLKAQQDLIEQLTNDKANLKIAGNNLAHAAARVISDYDGLHRLSLSLAEWYTAIANDGNRGRHNNEEDKGTSNEEETPELWSRVRTRS